MHRLLIAEDIPAIAVDIKTIARDLSIDVPSNSGSRPGGTQKRFETVEKRVLATTRKA